jgi:hypothetical protein
MQKNYSADDVAAAMSLQFFTVRFFLVNPKAVILSNPSAYQYLYSAYCLNPIFTVLLTQFSFDNYILGELVLTNSLLLLNSLVQIYDYVCSFHEEVMYLFRDKPRF